MNFNLKIQRLLVVSLLFIPYIRAMDSIDAMKSIYEMEGQPLRNEQRDEKDNSNQKSQEQNSADKKLTITLHIEKQGVSAVVQQQIGKDALLTYYLERAKAKL